MTKIKWFSVFVYSLIAIGLTWFNSILIATLIGIVAGFFGNPYTGLRMEGATGQSGLIIGLLGYLLAPISIVCLLRVRRPLMDSKNVAARRLFFIVLAIYILIPGVYCFKNIDFDLARPKNKFILDEATGKYKVVPLEPGDKNYIKPR